MKKSVIICSILAIAMILIPLLIMKGDKKTDTDTVENADQRDGYISVMKTENGKVIKLEERDYLIGVLAAEMDMTYHDEALKAQVVASYTYTLYMKNRDLNDELNGADISDDPNVHQGYLSVDERKEKWGESFEEYEKKAGEIVDSVAGEVICFEEKPILAVYHHLNYGKTCSAYKVWNEEISYLKEKESPGDRLSAEQKDTVTLTYAQFKEKVEKIDGIKLPDGENDFIGEIQKDENGYVESIELNDNKVSAQDFRTALGLKSCVFEIINSKEGKIAIETYGNGHMVGMSQYGADYMARQGSDYKEILTYYYTDVEIR